MKIRFTVRHHLYQLMVYFMKQFRDLETIESHKSWVRWLQRCFVGQRSCTIPCSLPTCSLPSQIFSGICSWVQKLVVLFLGCLLALNHPCQILHGRLSFLQSSMSQMYFTRHCYWGFLSYLTIFLNTMFMSSHCFMFFHMYVSHPRIGTIQRNTALCHCLMHESHCLCIFTIVLRNARFFDQPTKHP